MAKILSNPSSVSGPKVDFERKEVYLKNFYLDNEAVERLLHRYLEGACTDVNLRDEIMTHASELIRQIIKAHRLSQICPGKDDTTEGDLFQTAWMQIESALYKYNERPYCSSCYNNLRPIESLICDEFLFAKDLLKKYKKCKKCKTRFTSPEHIYYKGKSKVFNMWSQIARTVILAYIKKENRDRKNSPVFQNHLENKIAQKSHVLERFLIEARQLCKYNAEYAKLLDVISELYNEDDKPHEGFISKLVLKSGMPRTTITEFLRMIRLRSFEFSDSPVNDEPETIRRRKVGRDDDVDQERER